MVKAQRLSAQLRRAGHTTVAPSRTRYAGALMVRQSDQDVTVSASYDVPDPLMSEVADDVLRTVLWFGYKATMDLGADRFVITVSAPEAAPGYRGHAIDVCPLCDRRTAMVRTRPGVYVFPSHRIERANPDASECEGSLRTPGQALLIRLGQAPKANRRVGT